MTGPARILVVDDEPGMVRAVERVLGDHYRLAGAVTPREALARARELRPDLAILDVRMPETDGFALMAELRRERPDLDVIFMTGVIHELDAQLIRSIREKAFYFIQKPFDREVLLTLVERCLEQRRLASANARHLERLEAELNEARSFQQGLLPAPDALVEGIRIAARYRPCAALGGDFYDFARAGEGRAAVLVADVSGHGVSAAMLTALVKSAFHQGADDGWDPAAAAARVASAIRTFEPHRFVTLLCARLDRAAGCLDWVNAGHPPGLLSSRGDWRRLGATGPLVSPALSAARWEARRERFETGDRLLLYTDGLTEARGEGGFLEEDGLLRATGRCEGDAAAILDRILAEADRFSGGRPPEDDQTLVLAERRP